MPIQIPARLKDRVEQLFERMDNAYDRAAEQSGFVCNGCENNCCMTRFDHHTLLEFLYLREGLARLPSGLRETLRQRALAVMEQAADLQRRRKAVRVMCPLNEDGRCILYAHRPMICRLHGIPHALRRPDGTVQTGPGCDDYYAQCGASTRNRLDRTPLYVAMAQLEQLLRTELRFDRKIKMTVAEMIVDNSVKFKV